jgi:hypothetical protein
MEPSVFNIAIKRNKRKYGATSTVVMTTSKQYCCTMENTYATIKLQVLPNLLTPASTRKKVPHSIFETGLLSEHEKNNEACQNGHVYHNLHHYVNRYDDQRVTDLQGEYHLDHHHPHLSQCPWGPLHLPLQVVFPSLGVAVALAFARLV